MIFDGKLLLINLIMAYQGTYLTSTARSHARDHNLHEGTIIGKFNGEFWGVFASHQVHLLNYLLQVKLYAGLME